MPGPRPDRSRISSPRVWCEQGPGKRRQAAPSGKALSSYCSLQSAVCRLDVLVQERQRCEQGVETSTEWLAKDAQGERNGRRWASYKGHT
jgi:hypothetical protein